MKRKGFTLIEILVSMFILALVISSFVSVVVITSRTFRNSRARFLAIKIAEEGLELAINKRDNNVICSKNSCPAICDWRQGLMKIQGRCAMLKEDWNVDATKPDQLLAGNGFDLYNASSLICIKSSFENKFGICGGGETPIQGSFNRKVSVDKVPSLDDAVDVISKVTWKVDGANYSVVLEEVLFK